MPDRFIYMFPFIIRIIMNKFHGKRRSLYNIGTKFADFIRNTLRLNTSFQILFGGL